MNYETPKLIPLSPAIVAVRDIAGKQGQPPDDGVEFDSLSGSAYEDWE